MISLKSNGGREVRRAPPAPPAVVKAELVPADISLFPEIGNIERVVVAGSGEPKEMAAIKRAVCEVFDVGTIALEGKQRNAAIARPRMVAYLVAKKLTGLSLMRIAASFKKDHTTVMYGIDRIQKRMTTDQSLRDQVASVMQRVGA